MITVGNEIESSRDRIERKRGIEVIYQALEEVEVDRALECCEAVLSVVDLHGPVFAVGTYVEGAAAMYTSEPPAGDHLETDVANQ